MKTITRVQPKSVANVYGFFMALAALLTAIFFAGANIVNILLAEEGFTWAAFFLTSAVNLLMGLLVGLISAFAGFLIGYIAGWLCGWFYNQAVRVKFIGGIKIDLE